MQELCYRPDRRINPLVTGNLSGLIESKATLRRRNFPKKRPGRRNGCIPELRHAIVVQPEGLSYLNRYRGVMKRYSKIRRFLYFLIVPEPKCLVRTCSIMIFLATGATQRTLTAFGLIGKASMHYHLRPIGLPSLAPIRSPHGPRRQLPETIFLHGSETSNNSSSLDVLTGDIVTHITADLNGPVNGLSNLLEYVWRSAS